MESADKINVVDNLYGDLRGTVNMFIFVLYKQLPNTSGDYGRWTMESADKCGW